MLVVEGALVSLKVLKLVRVVDVRSEGVRMISPSNRQPVSMGD
jgi:hypothetical protein